MIKEIYSSKIKEVSINVAQTRIDSIKRKEILKTGLRLYENGTIGCAGAIGSYDEAELAERARKTFENGIACPFEPTSSLSIKEDFSTDIIDEAVMADEFEKLLDALRSSQPEYQFSHKLKLMEQEALLKNDSGLDLSFRDRYIDMELLFKERTSTNILDGFVAFNERRFDSEIMLRSINEVCDAYKNTVELPAAGRLPVIFSTQDDLPMIKFYQDLNGNNFGSNSSLFSGKTGKKLFNEGFTLYQTNNPADMSIPFFDMEGTVNKDYRFALIENGTLVSPYTDKKTAGKYGLPLTGSAAAEYDSAPTLGNPRFKIKESTRTVKELLKGKPGIYIMIAAGGDFTPSGDFGSPVQLAFLFDGEKLVGRLPQLQISANVFDMFGDSFLGVSSNTINPLSFYRYLAMEMNVSKL